MVYQPVESTLSLHLTTTCYYILAAAASIVVCTCCTACSFVFVHYKHTQQLLEAATRPCSHRDTLDTQHTLPSIPSVILTPAEQYDPMGSAMGPMCPYYHTLPRPLSQHHPTGYPAGIAPTNGPTSNVFNFPAPNMVPAHQCGHRGQHPLGYTPFVVGQCSTPGTPATPQLMERYSAGNVLALPQTPKMLHRLTASEVSEVIAEEEEEEDDGDSTNDSLMEREGTELEGTSMLRVSDLIAPASPSKRKRRSLHMTQAVFMGEKVSSQHAPAKRRCAVHVVLSVLLCLCPLTIEQSVNLNPVWCSTTLNLL